MENEEQKKAKPRFLVKGGQRSGPAHLTFTGGVSFEPEPQGPVQVGGPTYPGQRVVTICPKCHQERNKLVAMVFEADAHPAAYRYPGQPYALFSAHVASGEWRCACGFSQRE